MAGLVGARTYKAGVLKPCRLVDEIRPFHSNFDCFRLGSHPVNPSVIER